MFAPRVAKPQAFTPPNSTNRLADKHSTAVPWREPFERWMNSVCVQNPRCFGSAHLLHLAFCEWEIGHDDVPCTRDTFDGLLEDSGFLTGEVAGVVLVSGLTFKEDSEAVGFRPGRANGQPRRKFDSKTDSAKDECP
jgi:hypothetical protein